MQSVFSRLLYCMHETQTLLESHYYVDKTSHYLFPVTLVQLTEVKDLYWLYGVGNSV